MDEVLRVGPQDGVSALMRELAHSLSLMRMGRKVPEHQEEAPSGHPPHHLPRLAYDLRLPAAEL